MLWAMPRSTLQLEAGRQGDGLGPARPTGARRAHKGIVNALKAKGVDVPYLEISDAVNNDPSQGVPVFSAFYASNPDLKAVITDHGR